MLKQGSGGLLLMYKAVIFDLDGTLTDTLESMAVAGNKTLEKIGLKGRSIEEYKYFAGPCIMGSLIIFVSVVIRRDRFSISETHNLFPH